jgi:DNA-binding NarL/FixJ family response regulator
MRKIRLLLVDDHALSRESLGRLLAAEKDFEIAGRCGTAEAPDVLKSTAVDVVLLDFNAANGTSFIRSCRDEGFQGAILIVTGDISAADMVAGMRTGASGVFLKENSPDALGRAIRLVADGEMWMDRKVIQLMAEHIHQLAPHETREILTQRERQVLAGVFEGLTNKKIAAHIGVSEGTVKATLQQLFQKTQVRTRSQLVRAAMERSLLAAAPKSSHVY